MASIDEPLETNFTEAANHWNLEKLYLDLAVVKGKCLTPVEKILLRGLLCGYSPAEIAAQVYKSRNSSSVRVYLSNGLYKYIQELLSQHSKTNRPIKNWSRIANLLSEAGYMLGSNQSPPLADCQGATAVSQAVNKTVNKYREWQKAIATEPFYGRQTELAQLEQWIVKENCRLVALLGMGGVGKTALAIKIGEQTQEHFDLLIWRSIESAPPLENLLDDLLQSLSPEREKDLPVTVEGKISQLMAYLRGSSASATPTPRCLLVLDGVEAILRPHTLAGCYRQGYEGYGQLFRRLGEERHNSCCLLLGREKPRDIAVMAGDKLPVRTFQVGGLKIEEGISLLQAKGQGGCKSEQQLLVRLYAANPLMLKIVATTIQNLFDGDITEFLADGTLVLGELRELLDSQFYRLSEQEKQVMYGLAMHQQSVTLPGWSEQLVPGLSKLERLEALESLLMRCLLDKAPPGLLDKKSSGFAQQPVVRVYLAQKLAKQMAQEMKTKDLASLVGRTLLASTFNKDLTHVTAVKKRTLNALLARTPQTHDHVRTHSLSLAEVQCSGE